MHAAGGNHRRSFQHLILGAALQPFPPPRFLISDLISGACLSFILFTPFGGELVFCWACRGGDKHVRLMIAECFAAVRKRQLGKFLPGRLGEAVTSTISERHI